MHLFQNQENCRVGLFDGPNEIYLSLKGVQGLALP